MHDVAIVERLLADVSLIRLPLVRYGNAVSVGRDEMAWTAWLKSRGGS